jgi:mannose-6-phosphate isomerase
MAALPPVPLRILPRFKPAIWGGHSLLPMLGESARPEPIGEAWILSDQGDEVSHVADGPMAGISLRELVQNHAVELLGPARLQADRFPILLKILDARQPLSIQVHPDDKLAKQLAPEGAGLGKTEAWYILRSEPESQIFAGLKPGTNEASLQGKLNQGKVADCVYNFEPKPDDFIFLEAGTVHAIGAGLMLFEIQQTSDITYRLDDWGRVDAKTGKPRQLHIQESLACIRYDLGPVHATHLISVAEKTSKCTRLISCEHFGLQLWQGTQDFTVGQTGRCRVLVNIGSFAFLQAGDWRFAMPFGAVYLLPAVLGKCLVQPVGDAKILECELPE